MTGFERPVSLHEVVSEVEWQSGENGECTYLWRRNVD